MATLEEILVELSKFTIHSEIISRTDVNHLLLRDGKCEKYNVLLKPNLNDSCMPAAIFGNGMQQKRII